MTRKHEVTLSVGGPDGVDCADLLAMLNDYVDGAAAPDVCRELEAHLKNCNPCKVVVDTMRKTIQLYRQDEPCALPPDFQARLHECLRRHWKHGNEKA